MSYEPLYYLINVSNLQVVENLTAQLSNSYFQNGIIAPNDVVYFTYPSVPSVLGELNLSSRSLSYVGLNLSDSEVVGSIAYVDGELYMGGGMWYSNFTTINTTSGTYQHFVSYTAKPVLLRYNLTNDELSNLSATLPQGNYMVTGVVPLRGNLGLLDNYEYYQCWCKILNNTYQYVNGTYITESWVAAYNTTSRSQYFNSSKFNFAPAVNGISSYGDTIYVFGYNSALTENELLSVNVSSGVVATFLPEVGDLNPSFWTARTIAADNGFLTVGGNGLMFYNGTFEAPFGQSYGFLTGAAWDGSEFLVVGSKYLPPGGALAYLYYPSNDSVRDISSLFPQSMSSNATLLSAAWNGSAFYVLGSAEVNDVNSSTQLFAYNPATGILSNVTYLLPSSYRTIYNWPVSDLISTPYGTVIAFEQEWGPRLGLMEGNGSFLDLSGYLPQGFSFTTVYSPAASAYLAYANGTVFVAGTVDGHADVTSINLTGMRSTDYSSLFAGVDYTPSSLAFVDGYLMIGGGMGGIYGSSAPPFLYALRLGSQPALYNLTGYVPASFGAIATMASNGTGLFITSSQFGNVKYGFLEFADYYVYTTPSSASVVQGSSASVTVQVPLTLGWIGSVQLSVSGLPPGSTASLSSGSLTPPGSATLTISTSTGTPTGTYPITITASGGGVSRSTSLALSVVPPTYTVTFTESGLPSGTSWSVTFNSATKSSTTGTITYTGVLAGTYSWSVSTPIAVGTGV
ncbi:MAG: hypothetical protein ACP5UD_09615, partial [Conexivisphaera sp.]